jgi:hypothetical protein
MNLLISLIRNSKKMVHTKDRRESGRIHIYYDDEDYPTQETYWDDWTDYRDGMRDKIKKKKKKPWQKKLKY